MGEKLAITELDQYLFGEGTHYDIFKKLGAHPCQYKTGSFLLSGLQTPNLYQWLESLTIGMWKRIL